MKKRSDSHINEAVKLKERHVVVWTQEEDDILREQIRIYGTDNWTIVASKFNDKTTRQCRRRWYTYLNSDFKKGGWTPEEDVLLCEAQRKFGNKWTEIAKMVSGRTDNAVKNRFSTLCKKRAKREALIKENNNSLTGVGKKRILLQNESITTDFEEDDVHCKKIRRSHNFAAVENCNLEKVVPGEYETVAQNQLRIPLAALVRNSYNSISRNLMNRRHIPISKELIYDGHYNSSENTSLEKDYSKVSALVQQAESFTSLEVQVNAQNTEQGLEQAWKMLRNLLSQTNDGSMLRCKIDDVDFQLEEFKNLLLDFKNRKERMRQPDLYEESSGSSEYSSSSTLLSHTTEGTPMNYPIDLPEINQIIGNQIQKIQDQKENDDNMAMLGSISYQADGFTSSQEPNAEEVLSAESAVEFGSPLNVTPLFPDESTEVPSPQFSEREEFFDEGFWDGNSMASHRHQSITTKAVLQKGPPPQSMSNHSLSYFERFLSPGSVYSIFEPVSISLEFIFYHELLGLQSCLSEFLQRHGKSCTQVRCPECDGAFCSDASSPTMGATRASNYNSANATSSKSATVRHSFVWF